MAAVMVNVVGDELPPQGDTEASPTPEPNASSNTVTATATKAPPNTADQATADEEASRGGEPAIAEGSVGGDRVDWGIVRSVPKESEQDDDRNRNAKKPEKNAAAHREPSRVMQPQQRMNRCVPRRMVRCVSRPHHLRILGA